MARANKSSAPKTIKTTAKAFKDAIVDASGAGQRSSNASRNKSNAISGYCTKSGLSKKAFGIVLQLHGMEEMKRDDTVRQILMGYELMGWGKQGDLLDDVGAMIQAAAKAAAADEAARNRLMKGSPGLPLEALEKGIKPLDGEVEKPGRSRNALPKAPAPAPETVA
ncbi:hypothetical protein [Methylobacterium oxalidis]|uniref:Uncharacterized protein n=1 Tax=Methylobacterium oxalidis TaxID=944322 RepID=A0A512JA88_9HYPH|nr:hypothetical protein [Methylobacterium oxalidis]GEP06845.1 hypothetical protein MOX02_48830 [Methylobacterium oxalidis]GJE35020.1 hypothetical protein LDDCCGHA_5237 [Methylobacterium oxalidis]GLS67563.1 hypothetical protein GCM10007888_59470 [Methylobacterium oxalidis]